MAVRYREAQPDFAAVFSVRRSCHGSTAGAEQKPTCPKYHAEFKHECDDQRAYEHMQEVIDGRWDRWFEEVAELAEEAGHGHAIYRLGIEPDGCRPWQSKNDNYEQYRQA